MAHGATVCHSGTREAACQVGHVLLQSINQVLCRSDVEEVPAETSRWSQANLSAATQDALGKGRTQQGYPKSSQGGRPPLPPSSQLAQPAEGGSRLAGSHFIAVSASSSSRHAAVQPIGKSGLDGIFARMSPGRRQDDSTAADIDDDERDGSLLGGQEDSLYEGKHDWKTSRQ